MEDSIKKENNKKDCVAALDLGTNSSRLLIADKLGNPLFRDVRHVALGEGLAENKCFCGRAMDRAIGSYINFKEMMDVYGVKKYRAIATAACRMSNNTDKFLKDIKEASGIDVDVISEYEEARLTLKGAMLNAPKDKKYIFVYDLGGGSTEVTLATNEEEPKILATVSIPLGARNATEMYGLKNYSYKKALELRSDVFKHLNSFLEEIKGIDYKDNVALVATSSTPLRLAACFMGLPKYDKFEADGKSVPIKELDKMIGRMIKLNYKQRAVSPYIGPNRAPIFVAALVIFKAIYEKLEVDNMVASLKAAQEAIVFELL